MGCHANVPKILCRIPKGSRTAHSQATFATLTGLKDVMFAWSFAKLHVWVVHVKAILCIGHLLAIVAPGFQPWTARGRNVIRTKRGRQIKWGIDSNKIQQHQTANLSLHQLQWPFVSGWTLAPAASARARKHSWRSLRQTKPKLVLAAMRWGKDSSHPRFFQRVSKMYKSLSKIRFLVGVQCSIRGKGLHAIKKTTKIN